MWLPWPTYCHWPLWQRQRTSQQRGQGLSCVHVWLSRGRTLFSLTAPHTITYLSIRRIRFPCNPKKKKTQHTSAVQPRFPCFTFSSSFSGYRPTQCGRQLSQDLCCSKTSQTQKRHNDFWSFGNQKRGKAATPKARTPQRQDVKIVVAALCTFRWGLSCKVAAQTLSSDNAVPYSDVKHTPMSLMQHRPPAGNSFKMLRQASSTPLASQFQQTPPEPVSSPSPSHVISWDPSRSWRGPTHQPAQQGSPLLARSAMGPASSVTWGVGLGQSASPPVGGQTSGPTPKAHQVCCHQASIGLKRFDLPPTPSADANIGAISS